MGKQHSRFLNEYTLGSPENRIHDHRIFEEQVAKKSWKSVILSGEALSVLNLEAMRRLAGQFNNFDVQPILILREWSGYLFSRWKQDIKRRDAWTFKSYISKLEALNFEHYDCSMDLVCKRLEESFQEPPCIIGYMAAIERDKSVLPAILRAMAIPRELINEVQEGERLNIAPSNIDIERNRLSNLIYCDHNFLPEVEFFYDRPAYKKPSQVLKFLPKVKQSIGNNPALWSDIDNIIIETKNRFSYAHLKQPYCKWYSKISSEYNSLFFEGLRLKPVEEIKHWEHDIFETQLSDVPNDIKRELCNQLKI